MAPTLSITNTQKTDSDCTVDIQYTHQLLDGDSLAMKSYDAAFDLTGGRSILMSEAEWILLADYSNYYGVMMDSGYVHYDFVIEDSVLIDWKGGKAINRK